MLAVKRTDGNLMFLYAVFLAALSVGNVLDNSYLYLLGYVLPASILAYPITLLVTCIISELWEEKYASRLVLLGLFIKFVGIVLLGLSQFLKIFPDYGARYELWSLLGTSFWEVSGQMVLGKNVRFWSVSIISFPLAQFTGIVIFNALLQRHIQKTGGPWGGRWLRYLAGTMSGEIVEVLIFIGLAFAPDWEDMWVHALQQIYIRLVLTLGMLPLYYAITWRHRMSWKRVSHV